MPITDNMRMRIFAAYIGAPCKDENRTYIVSGVSTFHNIVYVTDIKKDGESYAEIHEPVTLILRPVSSLTYEECIALMDCHAYQQGERVIINSKKYSNGVFTIEYYFGGMNLTYIKLISQMTGKETDYLRSINIITDVHGINLIEAGIAILEQDKTGTV